MVTGATQSTDFPVSPNAHQPTFSDRSDLSPNATLDAFIARFSNSGQRLDATYFGGKDLREVGTAAGVDASGGVGIAVSGRPGSCMLRYDPRTFNLSEECYKLVLNGPLSIAFTNGTWVAAGSTMQGHDVPGVNSLPRVVVTPLAGLGDNSGPAVVGAWNEYIAIRRPLFAAGSIISIYGSRIGRAGTANTSVWLGRRELTLLYAGEDQINAIVPADMPIGLHSLTVAVPFFNTVPVAVDVVERWPGLYSGALNENGTVNSASNPSPLGSIISLFGNGFGPEPLPIIEPFIAATGPPPSTAQGMEVLYAGRAPGTIDGIFQVNARIPLNAQTGRVPVRLVFRLKDGFLQTPLGYVWIR